MPEISIIMPVYNIEKYLPRCLESILNQTFSNFEVLAVDDGSKDKSLSVLQEYSTKDARIKFFHQENGGASKARNNGLNHATGKYIAFIDGDDFVDENYLESLYQAIREKNAQLSMCGLTCVNENGDEIPSHFSNNYVPESISGRDAVCCIGKNVTFGVVWNKLYKIELFKKSRFTEGMTFEDEMILHHIYGEVDQIACVQDCHYKYVQRSSSKMKESYSPAKMDIIIAYFNRLDFMVKNKYRDDEIAEVNNRLIDFFRTAILKGRETKYGKQKFARLYRIYRDDIYLSLPESCHNYLAKFFLHFPIAFSYIYTLKIKMTSK